jgi:hypothetical protein
MPPKKTKAVKVEVVTIDLEKIDATALQEQPQIDRILTQYEAYKISTAEEYAASAGELQTVKGIINKREADRRFIVDPLNKHVKDINARFNPITKKLELIEEKIKGAQRIFILDQENRRKEEQRKIDEAQRKQNEAAAAGIDQEICEAMSEGDTAKAQDLLSQKEQQASFTPAAVVQSTVPEVAGQQIRKEWKVVVTDFAKVQDRFKLLDEKKLKELKKADDSFTAEGIKFEEDVRIVSSAKQL